MWCQDSKKERRVGLKSVLHGFIQMSNTARSSIIIILTKILFESFCYLNYLLSVSELGMIIIKNRDIAIMIKFEL